MKKKTKNNELVPAPVNGPSDLSDRLEFEELNRGVIRIDDAIDEYNTSDYMRKIAYIVNRGVKNIKFFITSPGGSAYHALALYDRIISLKNVGVKTEAYVEGWAASAASMIVLQAMDKRYATSNSRFLIHEPRRWTFMARERVSDMQDETKEMVTLSNIVNNIMAKRCKKSSKDIDRVVSRKEVWMSSREAKTFGLIDAIVQ